MVSEFLERYLEYIEETNEGTTPIPDAEFDLERTHMPTELPEQPLDRLALEEYDRLVNVFEDQLETHTTQVGYLDL